MHIKIPDFRSIKEFFLTKVPPIVFFVYLVSLAIFYALAAAYVPTQNGDNVEHIHSAFLISLGQVPYRDFFQHHNPLLWYLFAPLVHVFAYNATIAEVVSVISLLVFLKSLVYVYRISATFLNNRLWGYAAAAMVATPIFKLYAVDFRPDNYMVFCLMGGLYYYFLYLKEKVRRHLVVCFIWFCLAFFFAQKALFPLAIIGLSGLYFWYKKEIKTADMLYALFVPLIFIIVFGVYLYHYDMVKLYFLSNYTFNLNLAAGFQIGRIAYFPPYTKILTFFGFIGAVVGLFSKNKYWFILAVLFISEFLQRVFYFSPYSYYYWLMMYLGAFCCAALLCRLDCKNRGISLIVATGLYYLFYQVIGFYVDMEKLANERPYLPNYIARRVNPCDYVFNGDGMMYNLFAKDPAYYWQLIGQLDVIGEQTGIHPRPNIEELIVTLKPKFVFGKSYFNKFSNETGRPEIVHYVNKDILSTYYDQTEFQTLYRLKPQYDNRQCVQDAETGEWRYQD